MALPNPPTSGNGSKLFAATYDAAGTNTAAAAKSVKQTTVNAEVLSHLGIGTHKDTDTYASADPVVLIAGINSTDIVPLVCNASGHISINDGSNSITVDGTVAVSGTVTVGTHAVTQSGTWNVGLSAGTNNIGDVDILTIASGTNTIGGTLDTGWNTAAKPPLQGFAISQSGTTEVELLAQDASNLWNLSTIYWSYYSGSTAPAAMRTLKFRYSTGGTAFHAVYIPPTANVVSEGSITFRQPFRSAAAAQNINVILSGALGTSGEFTAGCTGYKSTT